jgi:hypothetical protein
MTKTLLLIAISFSALAPIGVSAESSYCMKPQDGFPYGSFGRQDNPGWRQRECDFHREQEREMEALRRRIEEQRAQQKEKAERQAREDAQRRDAVTSERRNAADHQRAADCITYATCPSTSQDLQEQLKRQK